MRSTLFTLVLASALLLLVGGAVAAPTSVGAASTPAAPVTAARASQVKSASRPNATGAASRTARLPVYGATPASSRHTVAQPAPPRETPAPSIPLVPVKTNAAVPLVRVPAVTPSTPSMLRATSSGYPSPSTPPAPANTSSALLPGSQTIRMRLGDVARLRGLNSNPLVGVGLVVGLAGTGDSPNAMLTQMMANALGSLGVSASSPAVSASLKVKNAAVVTLTADLPATSLEGDVIDVRVSSIGDASSLEGGTLLLSTLRGADGQVYASAQGPILVGPPASSVGGMGSRPDRNVGTISRGGMVVRAVASTMPTGTVTWVLKQNDFRLASAVARAINNRFGEGTAVARDSATVDVSLATLSGRGSAVSLISEMEALKVDVPAPPARVVVNERTGTVVLGGEVRLQPVAIAHGQMRISVGGPGSLLQAKGATVDELVRALNALGVAPRDLIDILQALKRAQALQAEIITM